MAGLNYPFLFCQSHLLLASNRQRVCPALPCAEQQSDSIRHWGITRGSSAWRQNRPVQGDVISLPHLHLRSGARSPRLLLCATVLKWSGYNGGFGATAHA
ncbi:hypothetical protein FKM82_012067 [Ascaphus truei]